MRRLIWKEWYEKRIWPLVFFVCIILTILISHQGFSFAGSIENTSIWVLILVFPGLLLGFTTFSRETGYECNEFILSRAIGWKKFIGAKFLVDFCVMLLGISAATVVYWFFLPLEYTQYLGFGKMLWGVGLALLVALMGYLPGFGVSVILPGVLGGGIVLCLIGTAFCAEAIYTSTLGEYAVIAQIISWVVAIIAASVLITRRSMVLSAIDKAKQYASYVGVISTVLLGVLILPMKFLVPDLHIQNIGNSQAETSNRSIVDISPDGSCILYSVKGSGKGIYMSRKSCKTAVKIQDQDSPDYSEYGWMAPDSLVEYPVYYGRVTNNLTKIRIDKTGKITRENVNTLTASNDTKTAISVDGKYACVYGLCSINPAPPEYYSATISKFCIIDVSRMRRLYIHSLLRERITECYWESANDLKMVTTMEEGETRTFRYATLHMGPGPDFEVEIKDKQ